MDNLWISWQDMNTFGNDIISFLNYSKMYSIEVTMIGIKKYTGNRYFIKRSFYQ